MNNTKIALLTLAILGLLFLAAVPALIIPAGVVVALMAVVVIIVEQDAEASRRAAERRHAYNLERAERVAAADSRYAALVEQVITLKANVAAAGCNDPQVLAAVKRAEEQYSSAKYFLGNIHWRDFFMDWKTLRQRLQAGEESASLARKLLDAQVQ